MEQLGCQVTHLFSRLVWTVPELMESIGVVGKGIERGEVGQKSGFGGNRIQGVKAVQLAEGHSCSSDGYLLILKF